MPWRALSPKPGPQSPPSVELQFSSAEFHGNRYFWLLEAALLEPVDRVASHASLQERLSFAGRAETELSTWRSRCHPGLGLELGTACVSAVTAEGPVHATLAWNLAPLQSHLPFPSQLPWIFCGTCVTLCHHAPRWTSRWGWLRQHSREVRATASCLEGRHSLHHHPGAPQIPLPLPGNVSKMCSVCRCG